MSFASFGLEAEILRAVSEQGYTEPTPIQRQAIPAVLAGHDLMAGAQTGTGKTAGFTLPLLHLLQKRGTTGDKRHVRALVLAPTRELAAQVSDSVRAYGRHLPLQSTVIFGGVNINPQINKLRRGVDVLIATPGRLLDHARQRHVDLSRVEILVLDEADRMLDMGFIHDIRKIIDLLPGKQERQSLLFSATFSSEIKQLANGLLNQPKLIEAAGTNNTAGSVSQRVHPVDKARKREMLSHMIGRGNWQQVLVFTRTKHGANRLARQLEMDGLSTAAIHGNKSQGARTKALADFKKGSVRVLVATDIAARGLDIDQLPHVVNFDLPNVPEDYVHRIGRTGRAGRAGEAVSLVSADEAKQLADIEQLLGRRLAREELEGYEPRHQVPANAPTKAPARRIGRGRSTSDSRPSQGKAARGRSSNGRRSDNRSVASEGGHGKRRNGRNRAGQPAGTRQAAPRQGRSGQRPQRPTQGTGNGYRTLAERLFGSED